MLGLDGPKFPSPVFIDPKIQQAPLNIIGSGNIRRPVSFEIEFHKLALKADGILGAMGFTSHIGPQKAYNLRFYIRQQGYHTHIRFLRQANCPSANVDFSPNYKI